MASRTNSSPRSAPCPSYFTRFARWTASAMGRPGSFLVAFALILIWAATGPMFHYSDTWQLVINTSTTIVTFLMVFLIQATQNRDTTALNVKLDELIRAMRGARNSLIDLDGMSDEELKHLQEHFAHLAERAKNERTQKRDTVRQSRTR